MPAHLPLPEPPRLVKGARLLLAYSGGLDSTALLHVLAHSPLKNRVEAVHVHHGLQAVADSWAQQCAAQCKQWRLPFHLLKLKIDARDAAGPEAAARSARYAAIAALMRRGDVLVTAHHQEDQAETVLLNLLRGAGVEGIAAMRELEPFGAAGVQWRPLLSQSRESLRRYAEEHGLQWVEDPHNADARYARSFLRAEIMPRLKTRWPQASELLARAASNCADTEELIQQWTAIDLQAVTNGDALSVSAVLKLGEPRAQQVLRERLRQLTGYAPSRDMLARIAREVLRAKPDAAPLLRIGECEIRRYRDQLFFSTPPLAPAPDRFSLEWDGRGTLELPAGCGVLRAPVRAKAQTLTIRSARGSEKIKLKSNRPSQTLKNLFQENAVPPWVRQRVPLIYADEQLICVGCRWWAAAAPKNMRGMMWQHSLPGWSHESEEQRE
jgi:tRNA(Ile)-lysidine synthase